MLAKAGQVLGAWNPLHVRSDRSPDDLCQSTLNTRDSLQPLEDGLIGTQPFRTLGDSAE